MGVWSGHPPDGCNDIELPPTDQVHYQKAGKDYTCCSGVTGHVLEGGIQWDVALVSLFVIAVPQVENLKEC